MEGEEITIYLEPDSGDPDWGWIWDFGGWSLSQARYQRVDVLPVEEQIRWHVAPRAKASQGAGGWEFQAQTDGGRASVGEHGD